MAKTLLLSDKMLKISEVMAESAVVEYEERDASENLIPVAPAITQPPPVEESSPEVKKETLYERAKRVKSLITVEPILACYVMPSVLAGLATQNLNLEKACRVNLKFGEEICDALSRRETANITYYEFEVQRLVASMGAWKSILQTALPCMIILFLGAWSDKTGRRKICILMPIIGEFMSSVCLLVNSYFFYELPMEAAMFSEALFPALMGGWFTMFVGVFSYIADITTEESRTFRVGVLNLCMSLGVPVGMALSGILLREIGYYGVFSTSATLYVISFTYAYFKVEEPNKLNPANKADLDVGFFRSFFDLNHVRDTFRVAFRHGPNHRRLKVSLLFVVVFVIFGPLHGEMSVLYLFTRYRFNWNEVEFSFYSTYCIITNLIGTVFSLSVFSKYLKLDDTIIAIISSMSKIFSSFAYAFATTTFEIYMAPIIEIFNGTSFIAMRSIASKLVSSEELGKVNSLFGLAEAMSPLVYGPLYAKVYAATIHILPGTVFLLGAALTAPAIFIFAWMYFMAKRDEKQKDGENVEPEPTEKEVKLLNPSIDPKLNIQSADY